MPSLKVISLGCSKNTVESEVIMGNLKSNFWTLIPEDSNKRADVILINTCGFIGDAKQESIDMIISAANLRRSGKIGYLYVMGCLVERYKEELAPEIKEVDKWFGVNIIEEVIKEIAQLYETNDELQIEENYNHNRELTTPKHYAYLKISEGCDRKCSFCAIPLIRGEHISRTIEDITAEARKLVDSGVKELILIAQDVTYYGVDIYKQRRICDLLRALLEIENLEWIRLQYLYPHSFPEDLLSLIATEDRICNYLDIPLQHISTEVLQSMDRATTKEKTMELLQKMRTVLPDAAIRTTLIVGYPNETEEDFEDLKKFIKEFRFERLGAFTYSMEEGTPAYPMGDLIDEETKDNRVNELMELQEEISFELNQARVGSTYKVIIDRIEGDYYIGRTQYDSPEVDNEVLILIEEKELKIGNFYMAKIVEADTHDLYASVV